MTTVLAPQEIAPDVRALEQERPAVGWFEPFYAPTRRTPLGEVRARARVAVEGTVIDISPSVWGGGVVLEVTIEDASGSLVLVFFGRRVVGGVEVGRRLTAGGAVLSRQGRLVILNPFVWLPG